MITAAVTCFAGLPALCADTTAPNQNRQEQRTPNNETPDEPTFAPVFTPGLDGYPHIRIPSVVVTQSGTVLAFAEGRQGGDHSENDIILKRSTDGGRSWRPLQVLCENGKDVMINPCAVVLDSGRVLLMFQHFPAGYHTIVMPRLNVKRLTPGLQGATISRTLLMHSDDDGKTWSPPRDVTAETKRPRKIVATASGPGIGIVLKRGRHKGRILIPTNESSYENNARVFHVYACYSDDDGAIWSCGQPAPKGDAGQGNEVQMVELADGSVLLNSRSMDGTRHRKVAISADGGVTWTPLKDELKHPEPQCMGTILRYSWPEEGRSRLLFANPDSQKSRRNGTVRLSYDEGRTWPVSKVIHASGYAYSCLTRLPDGSIGLLFEADGYKRIEFARFTLPWLTERAKPDRSGS